MTELYIIRHGQTTANVAGLKQGTIDDERTYLSETGVTQAKELASALDLTGFTTLYHSPLHRTVETAQIVNQTAHLPMVADDRLLEISYGDWDGQLNSALMAKYPDLFDPQINDVRPITPRSLTGRALRASKPGCRPSPKRSLRPTLTNESPSSPTASPSAPLPLTPPSHTT